MKIEKWIKDLKRTFKVVSIQLLGELMGFVGSRLRILPKMISELQAKRDLASGAEAFLVQMVTRPTKKKSLGGIPVIEEFLEVFANNFLGLTLIREIEFAIDLKSGAASMHKPLGERFVWSESAKQTRSNEKNI